MANLRSLQQDIDSIERRLTKLTADNFAEGADLSKLVKMWGMPNRNYENFGTIPERVLLAYRYNFMMAGL